MAALLDALARHIERDDEAIDPPTRLTAVNLARAALHAYATPEAYVSDDTGSAVDRGTDDGM